MHCDPVLRAGFVIGISKMIIHYVFIELPRGTLRAVRKKESEREGERKGESETNVLDKENVARCAAYVARVDQGICCICSSCSSVCCISSAVCMYVCMCMYVRMYVCIYNMCAAYR
jgi:hypothetical protein